jgi:hypothetical protein
MFDRMRTSRDMHSSLCTARCSVPLSRCTRITSQRLRIVAGGRNLSGCPDACKAARGVMHTPYRSHIRPAFTLQIGVHETQCAILRVVAAERRISLHIASSSMNSAIARSRVAYADAIAAVQRLQPTALSIATRRRRHAFVFDARQSHCKQAVKSARHPLTDGREIDIGSGVPDDARMYVTAHTDIKGRAHTLSARLADRALASRCGDRCAPVTSRASPC